MVTPQTYEQDYNEIDELEDPGLADADIDAADLGLADDSPDVPDPQLDAEANFEAQLQQKAEQLDREQRAFVEAKRVDQLGKYVQGFFQQQYGKYYQGLTRVGYGEDESRALAEGYAAKDAEAGLYAYKDKLTLERLVAAEEGVPQELFSADWDENTMRQRAQYYKATGGPETAEVHQLRQEVAQLRQQVLGKRPTLYNQPGSGGRGSSGSYVARLKSGKPLPSAREIDRITRRYLAG